MNSVFEDQNEVSPTDDARVNKALKQCISQTHFSTLYISILIRHSGRDSVTLSMTRMRGVIPPFPQYAFIELCSVKKSTDTTLP